MLDRLQINSWDQLNQLSPSKKRYWQSFLNQTTITPLTKVLGFKYFYDYKLINKNVLDPRYDSEVIFDVFDHWDSIDYKPLTAIELGGGSGCLSISLIKKFHCSMVIGELSPLAMVTLKRNLKINKVEASVVETNWWQSIKGNFDILITNPPYLSLKETIDGNGKDTAGDPLMALYGGLDGLDDYRSIFQGARGFINHWMVVEICYHKLESIVALLDPSHWQLEKIFYDLQKRPRMILLKRNN
jgi:release factor glutamine methyltransferase